MSTVLSVNLNKIALLRNSRDGNYPDPVTFGQLCLDNGAQGLTVHPRPDQRHIRPSDVMALAALVKPLAGIEFNVEGNPFADAYQDYPGFIELVEQSLPDQCTLVPDSNAQLTSDHGFDLRQSGAQLEPIIQRLHDKGVRVSLFMDPEPEQIRLAKSIGADRIELYTGPYAKAYKDQSPELESIYQSHLNAAQTAQELGLGLNAGHDLNLENLARYCQLPALLEVSIGHAMTVDSLLMGMPAAVQAYRAICAGK